MKNFNCNTILLDAQEIFKISVPFKIFKFEEANEYVPEIDPNYAFDQKTTQAVLAGFMFNRRVMLQGFHGTGKSTHIEQISARLNWPIMRINLDSHISRMDLIGRDVVRLKDQKQITEFQEGLLPWAVQRPIAILFDEYDAGRPEVMFVLQRILEANGKLTLLDQNKVLTPHEYFRLFATANTLGMGDHTGLYHGTQYINQGQLDRWQILCRLDYLPPQQEQSMLQGKFPNDCVQEWIPPIVQFANLTRQGFNNGDLSTFASPRTLISWIENLIIFGDLKLSFELSLFDKYEINEKSLIIEYFQRCFNKDFL